jgi:hypothetical protein
VPQANLTGSSWLGSLNDLAHMVYQIRRIRAFGRLSLRSSERLSIAHLYFRAGKLVHIAGNRGDALSILDELQHWTEGVVRFERGVTTREVTLNDMHEQLFSDALASLQQRGTISTPPPPRVIESKLAASSEEVTQLINPWEWRVLKEATRRIAKALARLVGHQEAVRALHDIMDDCSSAFLAFTCLTIAADGSLDIANQDLLDHCPREDVLSGFAAFFSTCEYFCVPVLGEREAHEFMLHTVQDVLPALTKLDVFHARLPAQVGRS